MREILVCLNNEVDCCLRPSFAAPGCSWLSCPGGSRSAIAGLMETRLGEAAATPKQVTFSGFRVQGPHSLLEGLEGLLGQSRIIRNPKRMRQRMLPKESTWTTQSSNRELLNSHGVPTKHMNGCEGHKSLLLSNGIRRGCIWRVWKLLAHTLETLQPIDPAALHAQQHASQTNSTASGPYPLLTVSLPPHITAV